MSHRMHLDDSIKLIGKLLFGIEKGPEMLKTVRPAGQPLVDDWHCLKTLVITQLLIYICAILCFNHPTPLIMFVYFVPKMLKVGDYASRVLFVFQSPFLTRNAKKLKRYSSL